jgi:monoamine oxidase
MDGGYGTSFFTIHSMADILVIGAGAAGLSTARLLASEGKSVIVLEARSRIGGRIHTLHNHGFSAPVEAGAEFIHGDLPLTTALIREAGIKLKKGNGRTYRIEQGQLGPADLFPDMDTVLRKLKRLESDMTIAEFLNRYFIGSQYEELRKNITNFVEGFDAADTNKASAFGLRDEWSGQDDDKQYHPIGGYSQLMDFLYDEAKKLGVEFKFDTTVDEIRWKPDHVEVIASSGSHTARQIVVTIPAAVINTGRIKFIPAIPKQQEAYRKIETGGVIKLLVEFNEEIWEQNGFRSLPHLHFLFSDAFIPTWWTQRPSEVPLITGWLSGPVTQTLHADDATIQDYGFQSLAYLMGTPVNKLKEHIKASQVVNWVNDPYAAGAYAYKTTYTSQILDVLSHPVSNTLFFAGEALYNGSEMGTVEAALGSAQQVAAQCLQPK